jgi:hypothetical protein
VPDECVVAWLYLAGALVGESLGGIVLKRPRRTGLLTVKLPHPIAAFTVLVLVSLIYLAGILCFNPALNFFKADRAWRTGLSRSGIGFAIIGGLTLLYLLRKAIYERAASKPGGIDITVISASPRTDTSASQIAAELRDALTDVHLSGPSVVPGESAPQDFLTEVRGAAEQSRNIWGIAVAAIALLSPRNAYRVSCTEQVDASAGAHGLSVEVARLPRHEASVTTVWADTWQEVVRQAACHIAAYILPRTKLSRRSPWTPWHGIMVSRQLFYSFDEARRLARAGRLEEALHYFADAMRRDPLNPYIRIEFATVQDQLGLWIDALASYVDAVTIESWFDRRVWKRYGRIIPDGRTGGPSWLTKSPSGTAALQVARYRAICSLAAAHRLAKQWVENAARKKNPSDQAERYNEAELVINRLRPLVYAYAELMMNAHVVDENDTIRAAVRNGIKENDIEILRRVFQFAALEESAAITRDFRWYHRRRWSRLPISQAAIRALPIWSALQYHYVEHVQALKPQCVTNFKQPLRQWGKRGGPEWFAGHPGYSIRWLNRIDKYTGLQGTGADLYKWPPDPRGVLGLVDCALGRQMPVARFAAMNGWYAVKRGWHEHYNAACVLAVGMITPELSDLWKKTKIKEVIIKELSERNDELVRFAINELSRAVVATDSQFAAGRSVWLRRGDQDLDDLRATKEYKVFVERYLPDAQPAEPDLLSKSNPTPLVISRHILQTVATYATLRGLFWREQAKKLTIEATEFNAEPAWWRTLQAVCGNYWDWRTRWELINKATVSAEWLNRFDPDMFAVTSGTVLDRKRAKPRNLPGGPEACQIRRSFDEGQRRLDRRIGSWLSNSSQFKCAPMSADYDVEKPIQRLDLLGKLLNESQLQLIEGAILHVLSDTSSGPVRDRLIRQLVARLIEAWEVIAKWVACKETFAESTPCFKVVAQAVSKLSGTKPTVFALSGIMSSPDEQHLALPAGQKNPPIAESLPTSADGN